MQELMRLIKSRQSARALFDPQRAISAEDMKKILEAARWAPTAHNMQNFEIVVVDDRQLLTAISEIRTPPNLTFIRENYQQLSFTEDELRRRKTGIMGTMFPRSWQTPDPDPEDIKNEDRSAYMATQIVSSSAILFVLYDPSRRAPASEGDFLGILSLGCAMENMWLMANALGIGVHKNEDRSAYMATQIVSSSAILFVLYDPSRRAPASEGDFLGILSLGCAMENMWLMANALGIGVH